MRSSPLVLVLCLAACGAAPRPPVPQPSAPLCTYEGVLVYADLYDATLDHPIAHGHELRGRVTLGPGATLDAAIGGTASPWRARSSPSCRSSCRRASAPSSA